jgi:hypothetical protein
MKHLIEGLIIGNSINLTVDGRMYKKTCSNEEAADAFFDAIIATKADPTDEAVEILLGYLDQSMRIANENGLEYDKETGSVYLKGFNTPIPEALVKVIEKYHEKNYPMDAWMNFWKLLMINPDKRVRDDLFDFIARHDFALTDNGYMVVYKAVELFDKNNTDDLNTFIAEAAYHVRKDWKCSLAKYVVYQDESDVYHITKKDTIKNWNLKKKGVTKIGNLKTLVKKMDKMSKTDDAVSYIPRYCTFTGGNFDLDKEKIQLGIPQKKERADCDSDADTSCSNGLHCGATSYVEQFASNSSVILVCLVNPANVVAVPNHDNSKMRVSEYFPFALAKRENGKIDIVDQPYLEHDYIAYEFEELERQIQAINDEEERVGVDVHAAEDDRNIEEVLKALQTRVVDLTA